MDRAILLVALVAAGVLIGLGGYFVLSEYTNPVFVNGGAIAQRIDQEIGNVVAARFSNVAVGAAHCPLVLNLTGRRAGRCTLPVADTELRFDFATTYDGRGTELRDVDALFVTKDAERAIAAELAERYGEPFDVRCPGPAVRAVAERAPVTCSIEAPDVLRRGLDVHASGHEGTVHASELAGVEKRAARVLGPDAAQRTEGSVVVDGRSMERYLRGTASADADGEVGRRGLLGAAHCPARIVLREGASASCTVRVGGRALRYDVHFEKGPGLFATPEGRIEVIALVREIATRYFERPAYTGGKPLLAHVDCGKALVAFVEPGSTVACTAKVGQADYPFAFQILDAGGEFSIGARG